MFTRTYERMTDGDLMEHFLRCASLLEDYHDQVVLHGSTRSVRRAIRRALREVRRIEAVAERRRLHLQSQWEGR